MDGNACLHGDRLWTVMHAYMEIVCGRKFIPMEIVESFQRNSLDEMS